jgi:ABC-type transport system, involved in lipoprotein release, permease component
MKVLMQLTLRNLKLNRKRTIVTIIGIILSGAMITGVATLVASFQDMMIRSTASTDGAYHATFFGVTYENSKYITAHVRTKTAMLSRDMGFARLEGSENERKPYLFVKSFDAEAFKHYPVRLAEGRFPAKKGEMVVSANAIYNGGADIRIGGVLTLDVGRRLDQGAELDDRETLRETETLEPLFTETFTVTGIIERPPFESYALPGYTAIAYLEESALSPDDRVDVSIVAKNVRKIFDWVPEMAEASRAEKFSYNGELLRWMGVTNSALADNAIQSVALIVTLLIVVGSVTVIYNAFAISVSERKKQFGMLSSVGATARQIRRMVFYEAFVLALIGIPIGILSGIGGIGITLNAVNRLLSGMFTEAEAGFRLVVQPQTIWFSIGFIALTILISAWIPAIRASRVSPMEAIRLTSDIRIKGKKLKTSRLTRRLFGIEGELALKNLKRHRKRYRATVFSLFISIVLYVTFSSFMTFGFFSSDLYYNEIDFDVVVEKGQIPIEKRLEFYGQIAGLAEVERHAVVRTLSTRWAGFERERFGDFIREQFLEGGDGSYDDMFIDGEGRFKLDVNLVSVGDEAFASYTEALGLDAAEYRDTDRMKGILVNWNRIRYPLLAEFAPLRIETGERMELSDRPYTPARFTLEIGAVTDRLPFAVTPGGLGYVNVIVSDNVFDQMFAQLDAETREFVDGPRLFMAVKEGTDRAALAKQIETMNAGMYPGSDLMVQDVEEMRKQIGRTKTVISIFLYGFVILIALIGVTNIFNTISTNIALRRREFAMLKSVGLTPAGFNRMIRYESLFYGLKALLYGLPVSVAASWLMYRSVSDVFSFGFTLPWREIAICVASVFVVVFWTMMHASAKLKRETIVDALKEENL